MPFIKQERRKIIDNEKGIKGFYGLAALYKSDLEDNFIQPGDRCYVFYKKMVDIWKANPRWTTAHEIYKDVMTTSYGINMYSIEDVVAKHLAWQVFFIKYVMKYEDLKEKENGTI